MIVLKKISDAFRSKHNKCDGLLNIFISILQDKTNFESSVRFLRMDVRIRKAVKEDCKKIRVLIQELADYEKMPDGPKISAEVLEADGFGDEIFFRCFVAEHEENVILISRILNIYILFPCSLLDLLCTTSHTLLGRAGRCIWRISTCSPSTEERELDPR